MAAPLNVVIRGQALNSFGFTAENTVSGIGLNTFGFLWGAADIWTDTLVGVTTAWIACTSVSESCE